MEFFCAKCQKKHKVTEIAADLWSICKEEVSNTIKNINQTMDTSQDTSFIEKVGEDKPIYHKFRDLVGQSKDEFAKATIYSVHNSLNKFVKNDTHIGLDTMMRGDKLRQMPGLQIVGDTASRGIDINLNAIILFYNKYAEKTQDEINAFNNYLALIPKDLMNENLCSKRVTFYYNKINYQGQEEYVLERVTDENNVPFAVDGEMLGFVRTCPYCGSRISQAVGRAPEIVIALTGSPRAGKTSCLTALTSALSSGKYAEYDLGIQSMQHDKLWKSLAEEVILYQQCIKVKKTSIDQNEVSSYSVLVRFGSQKRVLTFVDMPGEFWQSGEGLTAEFFRQYSGLYQNIDCIWFLIDKISVYMYDLGHKDRQNEEQKRIAEQTADDKDVIEQSNPSNIDANFRTLRSQLVAWGKEMPPVAVIISKPDVYVGEEDTNAVNQYKLFPMQGDVPSVNLNELTRVLQRDRSGQYFLREEKFYNRARDVRSFVYKKSVALFRAIEDNCPQKFYISMAAYGRPAVDNLNQSTSGPQPFHEIFPLIWTLAVNGVLNIAHNYKQTEYNIFGGFKNATEGTKLAAFDYKSRPQSKGRTSKEAKTDLIIYNDIASNLLMKNDGYVTSELTR